MSEASASPGPRGNPDIRPQLWFACAPAWVGYRHTYNARTVLAIRAGARSSIESARLPAGHRALRADQAMRPGTVTLKTQETDGAPAAWNNRFGKALWRQG